MVELKTLFFRLLRCALEGETPAQEDAQAAGEQTRQLYELSSSFDLAYLVGYELGRLELLKNDEIGAKFRKKQIEALWRCEQLDYETKRIADALEQSGIDYIFLKGAIIRPLYPEAWMRTSADVDILVREKDYAASIEQLCSRLGYTKGEECDHHTEMLFPSGFMVEVHPRLIESNKRVKEVLSRVWDGASPVHGKEHEYRMSNEMFYFYIVAHMEKHFRNGGCGIRPFIDLLLIRKNFSIDEDKAAALFDESGIGTFEKKAVLLAKSWFEDGEKDELCEMMEKYIFKGHVYGSLENRVSLQQIKKGGKLRYGMSRLFMSYDQMIELYPSLEGKKWLLPVYQVRRWFYHAFGGRFKRSVHELWYNQTRSKGEVDDSQEMFRKLGMI